MFKTYDNALKKRAAMGTSLGGEKEEEKDFILSCQVYEKVLDAWNIPKKKLPEQKTYYQSKDGFWLGKGSKKGLPRPSYVDSPETIIAVLNNVMIYFI